MPKWLGRPRFSRRASEVVKRLLAGGTDSGSKHSTLANCSRSPKPPARLGLLLGEEHHRRLNYTLTTGHGESRMIAYAQLGSRPDDPDAALRPVTSRSACRACTAEQTALWTSPTSK